MSKETYPAQRMFPLYAYVWVAALAAIVGFAAVYVTMRPPDNGGAVAPGPVSAPADAVPAGSGSGSGAGRGAESKAMPGMLPSGPGSNPLSTGQMTAFVFSKSPQPLPDVAFVDSNGQPRKMGDWNGKVVLLNLWATWCAPCRKEMPGLDRLQQEMGSDRFEVVALSVDRTGVQGARKFLDQIKVGNLKTYADPTARAASTLRAVGMPTTLLIDAGGREIGRLTGPAEWDTPEAKRLVEAALR